MANAQPVHVEIVQGERRIVVTNEQIAALIIRLATEADCMPSDDLEQVRADFGSRQLELRFVVHRARARF
jgi:hypothetical protein